MLKFVWVLGCLFWVPVMYLTFVAFWKTAKMFAVLIIAGAGVYATWIYFREISDIVTIAYFTAALIWPSWLAVGEWEDRREQHQQATDRAPYPRLTPEDAKRRILGEL